MKLNTFQEHTRKTAQGFTASRVREDGTDLHGLIVYNILGIGGEAGEVLEVVKKACRDDHNLFHSSVKQRIIDELGDVMYYIARIADLLDVSLEKVASMNINKRDARWEDRHNG